MICTPKKWKRIIAALIAWMMLPCIWSFAEDDVTTPTDLEPIDCEAWTVLSDGTIYAGDIEDVIAHSCDEKAIYIATTNKLYVEEFDLTLMQETSRHMYFLPDENVFIGRKKWQVALSLTSDMSTLLTQERVDSARRDDDPVELWLMVVRIPDPTETPTESA